MTLTHSRTVQYITILLILGALGAGYWYFSARAGSKLSAPQTGTLTSGLVGYWTFDGGLTSSSTATDSSSSGIGGTLTNGPQKVPGKVGQAINFWPNGVDTQAYINMGDPAGGQLDFGSGDFSVGFWMKTSGYVDQSSSINVPLSKTAVGTGNAAGYYFQYGSSNQLQFVIRNGSSTYSIATPTSIVGDWHYYMGTRSGSTMYFYQDGVSVGSTAVSGSTSNSEFFQVGSYGAGGPYFNVNGSMDELRVYNRALAAGEIQSLFVLGQPDKTNSVVSQGNNALALGLAGYWKLDENTGTSTADASVNAVTGTLNNGTAWTTGRIGSAASFDGTDDTLTATGPALSDKGSVAAWVRPTFANADGTYARSLAGASGSGTYITLDYNSFTDHYSFNLGFRGSFGTQREVKGVNHGSGETWLQQWHYVVGTWDVNRGGQIYVDGILETTFTGTSGTVTNGTAYTIGSSSWKGYVDEVRWYNRELSADEVLQLYQLTTTTGVDTSLKGYWNFNGSSISGTTAYDWSGLRNNGTLTNGPTVTPGISGQALSFNGTNSYIDCGNPASLNLSGANKFTLSAWVYPTSIPQGVGVISEMFTPTSSTVQYEIGFGMDESAGGSSKLKVGFYRDGSWRLAADTVDATLNTWVFITGTWDGTTLSLYKNGSLVTSTTPGSSLPVTYFDQVVIGRRHDTAGSVQYFPGKIDEPRIYNRALSASEVKVLYDQGSSDKVNSSVSTPQGTGRLDSGLAGYWKLDENTGTSATDSSTNGNTGTLTSSPTWTTGQIGSGVTFNGSSNYISVPDSTALKPGSNSWSVCTWANPANTNQTSYLVSKSNAGNTMRFTLSICAGDPVCLGGAGKRLIFSLSQELVGPTYRGAYSISDVTTGSWRYFCGVADKDANAVKLYVDGAEVASNSGSGGSWPSITNTDALTLGSGNAANYYAGSLDETRIYSRALSSEEIAQLYRLTTPTGTDASLKGYWSFNGQDVSGTTAYDRSGGGFNGTITGASVTPGKLGQGLSFNGSSTYVTISDQSALKPNNVTLSAWIKPGSLSAVGAIIEKGDANTAGYGMYALTSNKLCSVIRTTTGTLVSGASTVSSLQVGTWSHLAATYDGTTLKLYVNGAFTALINDGACGLNTGTGNIVNDTSSLRIGSRNGSSSFFNGLIDESRVYNRALSDSEIAALYNSGR